MTQAKRVQDALAAGGPPLVLACQEAAITLRRCRQWMESGHVFEAAALNADAGNVIGLALKLSAAHAVPDSWTLPPMAILNQLARLPVIATEHRKEVAAWIELNLADAPLLERLAAIRTLRLLDPKNPAWKNNHEDLERSAVKLWTAEVDRGIESEDAEAIVALAGQVESMGLLGPSGQRLLHRLDKAMVGHAKQLAASELEHIGDRLHTAWAAMDLPQAKRHLHAWHTIDERDGGGHEDDIRGPSAWVAAEQQRVDHARHVSDLVADVVRSLDEVLPSQVVERRYAALLDVAASIPTAVESRVAHRIAQARRQRARRYVVTLFTIIAAASLVTTAMVVRQRSLDRASTIRHLVACIDVNLREDRLHDAVDCWSEAVVAELTEIPELAARSTGIERALEALRLREERTMARIEQAAASLTSNTVTLSVIEVALRMLRSAEDDLTADMQDAFNHALNRAQELRSARVEEARNERLAEFEMIEAAIPRDRPAWNDLAGWRLRRHTIGVVLRQLADVRQQEAVAGTDLEWRADRFASRLHTMARDADERIARLEDAQRLAATLREIPLSEASWHRTWENLLSNDAALLDELDPAAWTEAGEAARAAKAVADWRAHVLPILEQSGLIDGEVITTAGRAKTSLESHLDMHAMYSPYRHLATELAELAASIQDPSGRARLRIDLDAAGLLDLQRSPIEGGYRYVRSFGSQWRAVDTRAELSMAAALLAPLTPMERTDLLAEPATAPIVAALLDGLDAFESHPATSTAAMIDLLTPIEACDEKDDLLRLAILRTIWHSLLGSHATIPPELRSQAADWISTMAGEAPTATHADWPRLAKNSAITPQLSVRRQARHAASGAPSSDAIERAWRNTARNRLLVAGARVIGGLLIPEADHLSGQLRVDLLDDRAEHAEVLVHDGHQWTFAPLAPIADGDRISPPKGVPLAPTIIFVTP